MSEPSKPKLSDNFEQFEIRAGYRYAVAVGMAYWMLWMLLCPGISQILPAISSWLPTDLRFYWVMLVLPMLIGLLHTVVIRMRTRGYVLSVDRTGICIRNNGFIIWYSTWNDLQFRRSGLLIRILRPVDGSGRILQLEHFENEPARIRMLRSEIRAFQPPRPQSQPLTMRKALFVSLIGVVAFALGVWLIQMGRTSKEAAIARAEEAGRAVGAELTWPTIELVIGGFLGYGSVLAIVFPLFVLQLQTLRKQAQKAKDADGTIGVGELAELRRGLSKPVELEAGKTYRYVNPTYLKQNTPSTILVLAIMGVIVVAASVGMLFQDRSYGAILTAAFMNSAFCLICILVLRHARHMKLLQQALNDRFRGGANGNLTIIRDGQSYPVELVRSKRQRRWETAEHKWGQWWEEYRSGDKVFIVDRRYWIVDEQR